MTDTPTEKSQLETLKDENATLLYALHTLGHVIRELAVEHRNDAKRLQGLQGKALRLADKLDNYASEALMVEHKLEEYRHKISKEKHDEKTIQA